MVAAGAGFVWSLNPTFSPAHVKAQILNTARVHASWNEGNTCGASGKWVASGGILNAAAAVGAECD